MVAAYARPDSMALDVGASDGYQDHPTCLKPVVGRIVGVDPSPGVLVNERVDERIRSTLKDFVPTRPQSFDLEIVSA